jgi:hypothetical protein
VRVIGVGKRNPPATFCTLVSAMRHGSYAQGRLHGARWTRWVTPDVLLAVIPVLAALCGLQLPRASRDGTRDHVAAPAADHARFVGSADVVGQRIAAWTPGAGAIRASAPY